MNRCTSLSSMICFKIATFYSNIATYNLKCTTFCRVSSTIVFYIYTACNSFISSNNLICHSTTSDNKRHHSTKCQAFSHRSAANFCTLNATGNNVFSNFGYNYVAVLYFTPNYFVNLVHKQDLPFIFLNILQSVVAYDVL